MFVDELAIKRGRVLREQKWRLYSRHFPPRRGERVLDVGVSLHHGLPNENYFLHRYPYPEQVTGIAIEDPAPLEEVYPGVTFLKADGRVLPMGDLEFDVVHSNAVVEHVGPRPDQARFVGELTRVAKAGLVTTPNRWFPFDAHTRLPFLHWLPRTAMIRGFDLLGRPEHGIWLLSPRSFRRLFPRDLETRLVHHRILGWPATTSILFLRR